MPRSPAAGSGRSSSAPMTAAKPGTNLGHRPVSRPRPRKACRKPINRGLHSLYIPNPTAEIGHCVHRIAMNPKRPNVLFMQKHWDVLRTDDAGDSWREVSGNLPTDFGFAIDVHAHEPDTVYVVPIKSDSEHYVSEDRKSTRLNSS